MQSLMEFNQTEQSKKSYNGPKGYIDNLDFLIT